MRCSQAGQVSSRSSSHPVFHIKTVGCMIARTRRVPLHTESLKPLILTARLEPETQAYFDQLRKQHFPPERNFVPAHVTLFHALSPQNEDGIVAILRGIADREHFMRGSASKLRFLGSGVAFVIDCPPLGVLRSDLAKRWGNELTPQDRHKAALHITVQNKATPPAARALFEGLKAEFQPRALLFEGLDLWRYLGGPWRLVERFTFKVSSVCRLSRLDG